MQVTPAGKGLPLTLHVPVVVNGVLLQFFFFASVLYPIFFHLGIFRHVLGPCHTCFGHVVGTRHM